MFEIKNVLRYAPFLWSFKTLMASSLLTLLDDITTVLDDVAVLSKMAAKKTAGVLGDDLALNAEQVTGVQASRELPVVWAVFKGSLINKLILVPVALLLSVFLPILITPLLMIGGAFLCYEGFEKVVEKFLHREEHDSNKEKMLNAVSTLSKVDLLKFEKSKIKGAIRTDFILSAEIIAITLGVVGSAPIWSRMGALASIALLITVFVYGLVAIIIKIDDVGLYLKKLKHPVWFKMGDALLWFAPKLMKALSILGTIAMFLVGGGILVHGFSFLHHVVERMPHDTWWHSVLPTAFNGIVGLIAGLILVGGIEGFSKLFKKQPIETI